MNLHLRVCFWRMNLSYVNLNCGLDRPTLLPTQYLADKMAESNKTHNEHIHGTEMQNVEQH